MLFFGVHSPALQGGFPVLCVPQGLLLRLDLRFRSKNHLLVFLDGIVGVVEVEVARQETSDERHEAENQSWQEHVVCHVVVGCHRRISTIQAWTDRAYPS